MRSKSYLSLLAMGLLCILTAELTRAEPGADAGAVPASTTVTASSGIPSDGPFGFRAGMSLAAIQKLVGKANLTTKDGEFYTSHRAPKPNSSIEDYLLVIDSRLGLVKVSAVSKDIETSVYGTELQTAFSGMRDLLVAAYGQDKNYDYLGEDSIWHEPNEWMMALLKKERTLASFWDQEHGASLKNKIVNIVLQAHALSQEKGWYTISYEFEGFAAFQEKAKAKDAGSL